MMDGTDGPRNGARDDPGGSPWRNARFLKLWTVETISQSDTQLGLLRLDAATTVRGRLARRASGRWR